jgi:hypothetical protein
VVLFGLTKDGFGVFLLSHSSRSSSVMDATVGEIFSDVTSRTQPLVFDSLGVRRDLNPQLRVGVNSY